MTPNIAMHWFSSVQLATPGVFSQNLNSDTYLREEEKEEGGVGTVKQSSHARAHTRSVPEVRNVKK